MTDEIKIIRCELCSKDFKNQGGLNLHNVKKHSVKVSIQPAPDVPIIGLAPVVVNKPVTFFSVRRHAMTVVVQPEYWQERNTPGGLQMIKTEGKVAQFEQGRYITDDPQIIDYLENRYKDSRFPILSDRQMAAMKAAQ